MRNPPWREQNLKIGAYVVGYVNSVELSHIFSVMGVGLAPDVPAVPTFPN